jgi:hypothetical protein
MEDFSGRGESAKGSKSTSPHCEDPRLRNGITKRYYSLLSVQAWPNPFSLLLESPGPRL